MFLQMVFKNQFGEETIATLDPALGANAAGPILCGGEGDPDQVVTAPENSLYVRTDASSKAAYLYRNTDGEDGWEALSGV